MVVLRTCLLTVTFQNQVGHGSVEDMSTDSDMSESGRTW